VGEKGKRNEAADSFTLPDTRLRIENPVSLVKWDEKGKKKRNY